MPAEHHCLACGHAPLTVFHEQQHIPVNSCLLVPDRQTALDFPTGDLELAWCPACGFIANNSFDARLTRYTDQYEETQGFSPRFRAFATELAQTWIDRHDIHGRKVLEIGCGKGEFLELMCKLGDNVGIGIDPSYVEGRLAADDRLSFITDFWSEQHGDLAGDVIVCRHTLEHIQPVGTFLASVRAAIGDRLDTVVLFELPDVLRVLEDLAFWDLYYEHCSYFSPGSLARLFRRHGFELTDLWLDFDDQYILLEATPSGGPPSRDTLPLEDDAGRIAAAVASFPERFRVHTSAIGDAVRSASDGGDRVVLWGAGSKAVSFLSTLGIDREVAAAVDVNPFKQGRFLAGTGHEVIAPEALVDDPPGTVFVMNRIYEAEITTQLGALGLHPRVEAL